MPSVKDFGITLNQGSDEAAATRLLNHDYKSGDYNKDDADRAADLAKLVSTGEKWAPLAAEHGFFDANNEAAVARMKNAIVLACEYGREGNHAEQWQEALIGYNERQAKGSMEASPMAYRLLQAMDVLPEFKEKRVAVYGDVKAASTWLNTPSKELNVAGTLNNVDAAIKATEKPVLK